MYPEELFFPIWEAAPASDRAYANENQRQAGAHQTQEGKRDDMKYCVATNLAVSPTTPVPLGGDPCRMLKKAGEMGYHAIEIHVPDVSVLDIPAIRRAMEETGVSVSTLGTGTIYGKYGLHLCDENEENQERLYGMVCRFIDCAAALSSRVTIGSIKGNILPGQDREAHLDILARALKRIDDYAAKKGVTMLLEATNRYENNVMNTAAELAQFIRANGLAHTRALLDAFHMNIEEADSLQALEAAKDVLGPIQFADNNRHYPGGGCFAFGPFADKIREIGYDGVLSVECLPLPDGDTAAQKAAAFLHAAFD